MTICPIATGLILALLLALTSCGGETSKNTASAAPTLFITASSGSMTYGGTVPTITPIYNGFVNGDAPSSLSKQPQCSTQATASSTVGSYPSSCSGAVDPNYTIIYSPGTVKVTADATADFGAPVFGQKSMSGFLFGVDVTSTLPTSLITPLAPHLWRAHFAGNYDNYDLVQSLNLGTVWDGVVSDTYGYPGGGAISGGWSTTGSKTPPYDNAPYDNNFTLWQQVVTGLTQQYGSRHAYWELWNEPDNITTQTNAFWYGTAQQFYQTYLAGYQILRSQLGSQAPIRHDSAFEFGVG